MCALQCDLEPSLRPAARRLQSCRVARLDGPFFLDLGFLRGSKGPFLALARLFDGDLQGACAALLSSESLVFAPVFALNAAAALQLPVAPALLAEVLRPLFTGNSPAISPSLQALAAHLRAVLPLDDLLQTSAGLDILQETRTEAQFAEAAL